MLEGRTVVITRPNSHKEVRRARFRLTDEFRAQQTPWLGRIFSQTEFNVAGLHSVIMLAT